MPKEAPYEWIRKLADYGPPELNAATEAKLNAVLNFVDYKGERFIFLNDAVTALLDSTHSKEYRRRLQGCAMMGKKDDFVRKVMEGRRYTREIIHTPYINHFRGPASVSVTAVPIAVGQPVPSTSTSASTSASTSSSSGRFVPPKAKDCAPPKPALSPHPGPEPAKPPGKRYAWVHPFREEEITQYNVQHPTETISMIIDHRHSNWTGEPPEIRTVLCMWQVAAALDSPIRAQVRVNEWICNINRYLNWEGGVRLGTVPSAKSILEQSNFIKLALDHNVDIFPPLDGTQCIANAVTQEQHAAYVDAVLAHTKARLEHFRSKQVVDDWMIRWHVPPAPSVDDCAEVAPPKGTTWEERDKEARAGAILLSSDDEQETGKQPEVATKKRKRTDSAIKVE